MDNPLISIIIPVFNGEQFLDRCFSTLKEQQYPNIEIIFVDNISTDRSKEIIATYCNNNNNAKLIECYMKGPGFARNTGIEFARGEFISFLDVDDELLPDKHNILLQGFKQYPNAGMVIGKTKKQYSDGRTSIVGGGPFKELNQAPEMGLLWLTHLMLNPTTCSYVVKSDILKNEKIRFASMPYGEDVVFNILVGLFNNVIFIDQLVCTYHRHPKSAVTIANQQMSSLERYFQLYEKFALPYFYERRNSEPFKQAFYISEKIAFRMLMKLIHVEKKEQYITNLDDLQRKSFITNLMFRKILFNFFPFNMANSLNERLYKIYCHI